MNSSVSVVITTYNRGPAIQETIDSVLSQTLQPLEIIVVDDGSTDGTPDWIRSHYGAKVRIRCQQNGGVAKARNSGLSEVEGDFVAFLDHDDIWLPEKLERQFALIKDAPQVNVVYCAWEHFDENGPLSMNDKRVMIIEPEHRREIKVENLLPSNLIVSMSIPLIRAATLRRIGGFDPAVAPCDDWDVWLRLAEKSALIGVDEVLVRYRQHGQQQSRNLDAMWAADRRVRLKNWYNALKRPTLAYKIYHPYIFSPTEKTYLETKKLLTERKFLLAQLKASQCLARYPIALFTRQWIYLLTRIALRNSAAF